MLKRKKGSCDGQETAKKHAHRLPSPSISHSPGSPGLGPALEPSTSPKRDRTDNCSLDGEDQAVKEVPPYTFDDDSKAALEGADCVTHWIITSEWPKRYKDLSFEMSATPVNKRKSSSSHRSLYLERLANNGVYMRTSRLLQQKSKDLCDVLLQGNRKPTKYTPFPVEQFPRVLERVQSLNEARIRKDILPWVVPSAETLWFCDELPLSYIGEEHDAMWDRCSTMGSTRPKPDYTAGLKPQAFTIEEREKLRNYSTPDAPFLVTPELSFPFLLCEVKSGERGMSEADRQNIHSSSIAVRAIIALFKEAFGKSSPARVVELQGQILVFSISHDNDRICIYGHFAVPSEDDATKLDFCRYSIETISLSKKDGADAYKAYNFVRNVYEQFAPEHWKRIKEATAELSNLDRRTGLSFSASDLALEDAESQDTSQNDPVFKTPGLSASALIAIERIQAESRAEKEKMERRNEQLTEQIDRLLQEMEQQREQAARQMEQQREQQREQAAQQRQLIDQLLRRLEQPS